MQNWYQTTYSYPELASKALEKLSSPGEDEVCDAVFGMGPWRAPGPEGFPAGFFQGTWEDEASSLCEFASHVWQHPKDVSEVKNTDLCLIPKVPKSEFINHFRSIYLCDVSYIVLRLW